MRTGAGDSYWQMAVSFTTVAVVSWDANPSATNSVFKRGVVTVTDKPGCNEKKNSQDGKVEMCDSVALVSEPFPLALFSLPSLPSLCCLEVVSRVSSAFIELTIIAQDIYCSQSVIQCLSKQLRASAKSVFFKVAEMFLAIS